ncbi:odv-e56 [Alphabaculovirus alterspexiguae]|uniref:Odv-e56 n=1 Tax=Spodoptera exigua multiple nucleopolyhedrovirus TaxID=10454 RepID=A0A3G2JTV0_9ABAC|nr:odv-e56 [Spodoptera exigua multiple nucleopolyhedrovirus]AYN44965.1 odv-e56 [Spodoptera exigua multiple nucleopolyhedrovirus]
MSFFRPLRRVNKQYTNPGSFLTENALVIDTSPFGFKNVLSNTSTVQLPNNQFRPGYNLQNNTFISTAEMNTIMRNNDSNGLRRVFGNNISQDDYVGLNRLRNADNVPDANMHSKQLKRDAVKQNHPSTNTNTPEGIQNSLNQNPRLADYLDNMKKAGVVALLGVGVYITFNTASLIQDIRNALNRTGGSYHATGLNGGNEVNVCLLRYRTCVMPDLMDENVTVCINDPLLPNGPDLYNICNGHNLESEKTVCRASDPNAEETSLQYVDISELSTDQMIYCIEPYNLADLIGDLGLDGLLGDNGLFTKSSNSSTSLSDSLLPVILMIGAIALIILVGYFIFKKMGNTQTISVQPMPSYQPIPITSPVPIQVR